MAVTVRALSLGGLAALLLVVAHRQPARAQENRPTGPEIAPAPAPVPMEPAPMEPAPQYPGGYDAVEAGQEAYARAEAERQAAVARQLELNRNMLWYSGTPGYVRYPASVAAIYGYPPPVAWGPRRAARHAARYAAQSRLRFSGYFPYPAPLRAYRGVFEPWPLVPGYIHGYPYVGAIRQPIGQVQVQIGPGVTLSRPVYPGEQSPQGPTPAPPQNRPETIPAPAPIEPEIIAPEPPPEPPPAPVEKPGPREF